MPSAPQTPRRMRVVGGVLGGVLRPASPHAHAQAAEGAVAPPTPLRLRFNMVVEAEVVPSTPRPVEAQDDANALRGPTRVIVVDTDSEDEADDNGQRQDGAANEPLDGNDDAIDGDFDIDGANPPRGPPPEYTPYTPTGIPMVKRYLPTPPSELHVFDGPCFLLTTAQETGVFQFERELLPRIAGLGRAAVWEYRRSRADAVEIYTAAYEAGQVFAIPLEGSDFVNNPFEWVPDVHPNVVHRDADEGYYPDPDHMRRPRGMYKFYFVKRGEEVGVFGSWHEAAIRIKSLRGKGAAWKRYWSYVDAKRAYRRAFYLDELAATPIIGGQFDIHAPRGF